MKEIGGYFELDQLINQPFYNNLIELNTARNALIYLVHAKNIKKVYLPYFLCDSVSNALKKKSIDFEFYHINEEFYPLLNKNIGKDEYIYIVNYYGQFSNAIIRKLKDRYKNIIVDNTQAFYQRPIDKIDTIYSCRKYFGLPDGAYLSTESTLDTALDIDKSSKRMKHILGRYEERASNYYNDFKANDEKFKDLSLMQMSKLTKNLLGAIDYNEILTKRNRNYDFLDKELKSINPLNLVKPSGPFTYPYYVDDGIKVREILAKRNIYIPTLWPNVLKDTEKTSIDYKYAANILPLPCDQRYSESDMNLLVEELKNV